VKYGAFLFFLSLFGFQVVASGGERMVTAQEVIKKLDLQPLQDEGGYFRETYRNKDEKISPQVFGFDSSTPRIISTAIYYLVVPKSFSALHRIKSDEVFHFYGGDPVEMIQIDEGGSLTRYVLGSDIFNGESPQVVVPHGVWQALRLKKGGHWALMGTTCAPGFEYEDFELGEREKMIQEFPQLRDDIIRFSREPNEQAH
jgi:uncharacterized protein